MATKISWATPRERSFHAVIRNSLASHDGNVADHPRSLTDPAKSFDAIFIYRPSRPPDHVYTDAGNGAALAAVPGNDDEKKPCVVPLDGENTRPA